ncbi:MAG TPA: MFS transporter [Bdellovibrionales bacterium]|nr:MFS transporter [Bdellovibrionales bacterium]
MRRFRMRINWFLILLAYAGLFVYGLVDNARGPVFPDILSTFALSDALGSVFFFLSSLAATLVNATAFWWLKRWHSRKTYSLFIACQVLGMGLIAVSPTYPIMLLGVVLFGFSMGGMGLLVNVFAAEAAEGETRRRVLSGLHGMYGIASLISPVAVTVIYSMGGDWRSALGILAIAPALVFILSFVSAKTPDPEGVVVDAKMAKQVSFVQVWPFVIMVASYVVAEVLLGSRMVLFTRRELGYSVEYSNFLLSGFFMALFIGRMSFAVFTFRFPTRALLLFSAISGLAFFVVGLLVNPIALIGCGLTFSFFYPCAMAEISEKLGPSRAPVVMSWVQTFQSIGILSMHFLVGVLSDKIGLAKAFWLGPLALVVVIICLIWKFSLGEQANSTA